MPTLSSGALKPAVRTGFSLSPNVIHVIDQNFIFRMAMASGTINERLTLSYGLFESTRSKWKSIAFARWNRNIGDLVLAIEKQNHVSTLWYLGQPLLDE